MSRTVRGIPIIAAVVVVAVLAGVASAGVFAQVTRKNTLAGHIQPPGSSDFAVAANSVGDLPGVLELRLSLVGTSVVDGDWTLVVQRENTDGTWTSHGVVSGRVVTGTVTMTDNTISALRGLQLSVDSGTDEYASAAGTGSLDGTITAALQFTGNISLAF